MFSNQISAFSGRARAAFAIGALCIATAGDAQTVQQQGCTLSIFFATNVSAPTSSQAAAIAAFVQGAQTGIIAINGFASETGPASFNLVLSQRRANSVAAVVTATGANVAAQGFGETGPGASNQRTDVVRDECAGEQVFGPGLLVAPAIGLGALLIGGGASVSTGSATGTP